jgi:hypothetical protein
MGMCVSGPRRRSRRRNRSPRRNRCQRRCSHCHCRRSRCHRRPFGSHRLSSHDDIDVFRAPATKRNRCPPPRAWPRRASPPHDGAGPFSQGKESFEKRTTCRQPNEDRCDDHSPRPRPTPAPPGSAGRPSRSRMRFSRSSSISEWSHPAIRCSPRSTSEVVRDQRVRHAPGTRRSRADRRHGPTN